MSLIPIQKQPKHWNLLTKADQEHYIYLQKNLSSPACKNRRNHSKETFGNILSTIKKFVQRNDENDWKRALVCGVGWIDNVIAVNTRQLRLLIAKCKSSINGSFQALGYGAVPTSTDTNGTLTNLFPTLKNDFAELRQWSVRQESSKTIGSKLSNVVRQAIAKTNEIEPQISIPDPPKIARLKQIPSIPQIITVSQGSPTLSIQTSYPSLSTVPPLIRIQNPINEVFFKDIPPDPNRTSEVKNLKIEGQNPSN